mmetsp:Transcript_16572/g.32023  ORF Transcript_16572/g.32023 Transcript_16572/m.32023 type:complete len:739 (+) Transcript_16572:92-2308(+)
MRYLPQPQHLLLLAVGLYSSRAQREEEALAGHCGTDGGVASTGEAAPSALQLSHGAEKASAEFPPQATEEARTKAVSPSMLVSRHKQRRAPTRHHGQRLIHLQPPEAASPQAESTLVTSPKQVAKNSLLTDKLSTSENFELSFFLTVYGTVARHSTVLLFTKTNYPGGGQYLDTMPGLYLSGGSTRLSVVLGHDYDHRASLNDVVELDLKKDYHINVHLEGDTLTIQVNGNEVAVLPGYWGTKYPPQSGVSVWACDGSSVPANATIALLTYNPLPSDGGDQATQQDTKPKLPLTVDNSSQKVEKRRLLINNLTTGSNFEIAFDVTPKKAKAGLTSILRVTKTDTPAGHLYDAMPAFYFHPDTTQLVVVMGREDDATANITSEFILEPLWTWHVEARLQEDTFSLSVNGMVVDTIAGYRGKKYGPVRNAKVWIGDDFYEPADAEVSAITYAVLREALGNETDPAVEAPGNGTGLAAVHSAKPQSSGQKDVAQRDLPKKSSPKKKAAVDRGRPLADAAKHMVAGKVTDTETVRAGRASSEAEGAGVHARDAHTAPWGRASAHAGKRKTVDADGVGLPSVKQVPSMTSNKAVTETGAQLPLNNQSAPTSKDEMSTNSVAAESVAPGSSTAAVSSNDSAPVATNVSTDNVGTGVSAAAVPSTDNVPVATKSDVDDWVAVNETHESQKDSLAGWGTQGRRRAIVNLIFVLVSIGACTVPPIYFATLTKHADKCVQTDLQLGVG